MKPFLAILSACLVLGSLTNPTLSAQPVSFDARSRGSGPWSDAGTRDLGRVPQAGDRIIVTASKETEGGRSFRASTRNPRRGQTEERQIQSIQGRILKEVNGQAARIVSVSAGVVDWEIELRGWHGGPLAARAVDRAGNAERTGHRIP